MDWLGFVFSTHNQTLVQSCRFPPPDTRQVGFSKRLWFEHALVFFYQDWNHKKDEVSSLLVLIAGIDDPDHQIRKDDVSSSVWDWLIIFGGNKSLHCSAVRQFILALIASQYTAELGMFRDRMRIMWIKKLQGGLFSDGLMLYPGFGYLLSDWPIWVLGFYFSELKLYSWSQ